MESRALAGLVRDLFGGAPRVVQYWDDAHEVSVPVLHSDGRPEPGHTAWATVGMSHFDNGRRGGDGRALRVELLAVCRSRFPAMGAVLAGCAFNVASGAFSASPQVIFPQAVAVNEPTARMRHALLTDPFTWEIDDVEEDDRVTTWLQVVPVDDAELAFAREHGVSALRRRLAATEADVADLDRPTCL